MTTAPFNFKGTTVRCGGIVGTIGAQDTRNDTTWYAVDFTLNSKPMRIWRQPKALDIIAGVVKVAPVVTPDKPDLAKINTVVVDSTLNPENGVLSPQKGEISNDPTAEIKRDAEDLRRIDVHVRSLAAGDIIEHIRLDLHRPYDTERLHIMDITPHVALEPRRARVAVFRGIQRDGESNWTSCGFVDVEFPTLTVAPFRTVVGGDKLIAARRDPTLLMRTQFITPRWVGKPEVLRLPVLSEVAA